MKDDVVPKPDWEFDEDVTACFDDMLARSIPQYDVMRDVVYACVRAGIGKTRAPNRTPIVVDLGASRGEAVSRLVDNYGANVDFVLCEISRPMLKVLRDRFRLYPNVYVNETDLRKSYPTTPANVVLSVLTLQFVPINYRQAIVEKVYASLPKGGHFVLVEKVLGEGEYIDSLMRTRYHELKNDHGYSYEDINAKSSSLEGVLVPVTEAWNRDLLHRSGFRSVDCVWRWMNFGAWLAVK